jgi:hypothetical protein
MTAKRTEPIAGSSINPSRYSKYMLKPMWMKFSCRNPLVSSRQYWWLGDAISSRARKPSSMTGPWMLEPNSVNWPSSERNTSTLIAISA